MQLYDKLGQSKFGNLVDAIEAYVEEERNGLFELTFEYPNNYYLSDKLEKECIVIANANDTLRNQKFRIYDTQKFIDGTITVFARHVSFDLMYDIVNDVTFTNQSAEYALNQLFRQSQFSTHYRGYSDIINAQDYSMSMCNILEAIGGKEGSIIDTFGTGAEILRDNENIHVLNRRGHDNSVSIEYAKNLTGFELEEDTTDLVTRIIPFASYTDDANKEIIVKANAVDSPLINNYSHPYIKYIDYSDKFEGEEVPTTSKLTTFAQKEYRDNKVDIPKQNYKIEFIPLSKCAGYEGVEDNISLCDLVTIKNWQYNINTQAKVIKYKFDVLADRYESMELGEPKTTLGDIVGGGGSGDDGKPGPPGNDGEIGPQGIPGKPGVDGITYYTWLKYADDINGSGMSNLPTGKSYIGLAYNKLYQQESNNPNDYTWSKYVGDEGIPGKPGDDGITYYTWLKYADDAVGNGMSDNPVGKDYLGLAYNKTQKQESNNPNDYAWTLIKGDEGVPGIPGEDGITYYTWVKYADTPTTGMSDNPENKDYIGFAYNKVSQKESNNYADYAWSKIKGEQGIPGEDGNIGDFPNSLPSVPTMSFISYGLGAIGLSWTYENEVYYTYEVYASKTNNFVPNTMNLIHEGQTSSYLFQAKPGERWYFKACAKNSHGNRTGFSNQITVTANTVDDFDQYFSSLAVSKLVADIFSVNYMEAGIIKGNWIDAKQLSVTDGNGKRTLDIDSFGNIYMSPSEMRILARDVVEFIANNGRRDMLLYGGQVCAYNNMDNSFISTIGAILNNDNTFKGTGFIAGKHCGNFVISRDANWDDILTNRSPSPTTYMDIDFVNNTMTIPVNLTTNNINMKANNLYDCNVAYIKDLYAFGWKDYLSGKKLLTYENGRLLVNADMSFNGNQLMSPDLYTNKFNFTNGYHAFGQHESGANVMMNGIAWDWQGWDIVNARLVNSSYGIDVLNSNANIGAKANLSTFDEIEVISTLSKNATKQLDVSNVTNKEDVLLNEDNADLGKLVTLLFAEVKNLKNEIEMLKAR